MGDEYEWDENKNRSNIKKHGIDFVETPSICEGDHLVKKGRTVQGEVREMLIGWLHGRLVTAIFTRRNGVVRVISLRRARDEERREHEEAFSN